jgi:hypothetical protein
MQGHQPATMNANQGLKLMEHILGDKNVTIQGSQIADSQSLARDKKNDPEYKPISRTKYTY